MFDHDAVYFPDVTGVPLAGAVPTELPVVVEPGDGWVDLSAFRCSTSRGGGAMATQVGGQRGVSGGSAQADGGAATHILATANTNVAASINVLDIFMAYPFGGERQSLTWEVCAR